MKSATTVVALVLTLLVWASVAKARVISTRIQYTIPTPAPDGQASCALLVTATKDAGAEGPLIVRLFADEGEAQIPELGIGAGFQDGCDIFPNKPFFTSFALDISGELFAFKWTLEVHAHPDADCEAGGTAEGFVGAILFGGNQVEASLFCE